MTIRSWWIRTRLAAAEVRAAAAHTFRAHDSSGDFLDMSQLESRILLSASPMPVDAAPAEGGDESTMQSLVSGMMGAVASSDEIRTADDSLTLLDKISDQVDMTFASDVDVPSAQGVVDELATAVSSTDEPRGQELAASADGPSSVGALAAIDAEVAVSTNTTGVSILGGNETNAETPQAALRKEIAFVDSQVLDYQQLIDDLQSQSGLDGQFEIVLLDANRDGVEQISEALAGYHELDAIHLISHGTDGAVKLGSTWLTSDNLAAYAEQIAGWGGALTTDGDLLLYGCDLAAHAKGQELVDALGALTGADVAASIDDTGNATLGGNWNLEYATGSIETKAAFSADIEQNWSGLLATFTVTNTNDSGAGSLRQAIINANGLAGTDTITFNIAVTDTNHFYYRNDGIAGSLSTIATTTLNDASISDFDPDYPAGTARSWYRIRPASELLITDAVIIDGTTQTGFSGVPLI
ncbi:MAG: DUF4347 domain-containing protein, partial [Planctomycetota bacterium]